MADIRHKLVIKTNPQKVYETITTQQGLESWWCKQTTAKPEVGFVNVFVFGQVRIELKILELVPNKAVKWECVNQLDEWTGTRIEFHLEEKDGNTVLRFNHESWKAVTDTFAMCNYDWARFLASLKSLCETGVGTPA